MKNTLLLLILLSVFSCKKKVIITGRVYNPVTNEGIPNIQVTLSTKKAEVPGSVDGSGYKTLFTTSTDESGHFYIEDRISKRRQNKLTFLHDDSKYEKIEGNFFIIETNVKNQVIDYRLVPVSYFKYKIKNADCFNEFDKIEIYAKDDFGEIPSSIPFTLNGCTDLTEEKYIQTISGNRYLHWLVTKNNIVTTYYDTITLIPFEQRLYEIVY